MTDFKERFNQKFKENPNIFDAKLKLIVCNVTEFETKDKFDLVCAIGLLHFLNREDIENVMKKIKNFTNKNGVNVIAARMIQNFRNDLPHVFKHDELKSFYQDPSWDIKEYNEIDRGYHKIAVIISQKLI